MDRFRNRLKDRNLNESSQVKCLIPISQRAAKAVRAKTLRVLVVFCGAAPPVFRLPDGLIYVSFHSHSQFDFVVETTYILRNDVYVQFF